MKKDKEEPKKESDVTKPKEEKTKKVEVESVFEKILFTTVRIGVSLPDESWRYGTGFIFDYIKDNKDYVFLVTNKHVIKDSVKGSLTFNREEDGKPVLGKPFTIEYSDSETDFEKEWIEHPNDDIDIAITPFAPVLNKLRGEGIHIFFIPITQNLIPSEKILKKEIDAVEDIIFIGYPNNIYDRMNLLPIVRKGITATPVSIDFEGKPIFLIDASVFPGSSGSPVFLCNIGSYSPKGKGLKAGSRIFFLGIISSVLIRKDENTIKFVKIPTEKTPIVETTQMIDLGMVYKSTVIMELIEKCLKSKDEMNKK